MIVQKSPKNTNDLSNTEIVGLVKKLGVTTVYGTSFEEIHKTSKSASIGDLDLVIIDLRDTIKHLIQVSAAPISDLSCPILLILSPNQLKNMEATSDTFDFIVAPINTDELELRIRKLTIQEENDLDDGTVIIDDLTINPANYDVTISGKRIDLRFKEYELLLLLASNPGRVYDRATLLSQIWGYDYFGGTRTVDVHVRRLRSKIETESDKNFIETIWNVGYRFKPV